MKRYFILLWNNPDFSVMFSAATLCAVVCALSGYAEKNYDRILMCFPLVCICLFFLAADSPRLKRIKTCMQIYDGKKKILLYKYLALILFSSFEGLVLCVSVLIKTVVPHIEPSARNVLCCAVFTALGAFVLTVYLLIYAEIMYALECIGANAFFSLIPVAVSAGVPEINIPYHSVRCDFADIFSCLTEKAGCAQSVLSKPEKTETSVLNVFFLMTAVFITARLAKALFNKIRVFGKTAGTVGGF